MVQSQVALEIQIQEVSWFLLLWQSRCLPCSQALGHGPLETDCWMWVIPPSLVREKPFMMCKTPPTHSQPSPEALMVGGDSPRWGSLVSAPSPVALGCQGYMLHACAVLVAQSCPTLCDPMNCSPRGSSVRGDFPGKNTEWAAMPSCRASSRPRNRGSSALQMDSLPVELPGKPVTCLLLLLLSRFSRVRL